VLVSGVVGICTAFYFMRSRRKGKIFITKNVSIPKNKYEMTSSASSSFSEEEEEEGATVSSGGDGHSQGRGQDRTERGTEEVRDGDDDGDEEKLNIGFGSDPSWTDKKNKDSKAKPERKDLLHTGSSKGGKLVVVLVGLPGSGKTYIARKVSRYLRWISYRTRVFSLAKYRLEKVGTKQASFFDPDNQINYQMRVKLMMLAVSEAMQYLNRDGEIAIIDGTNYCRSRRDLIRERVSREEGFEILWIESIISSDDERVKNAARNNHNSPDYMDENDFNLRMHFYKQQYETLGDDEGSYIRTHDSGKSLNLHMINGFLRTKIASFVMNLTALHTANRPIYMTRAGETQFIKRGLIGGDSELTASGIEFAKALGDFLQYDDSGFSCLLNTASSTATSSKPRPQSATGDTPTSSTASTPGFEYDFDNFGLLHGGAINVWTSTMRSARETAARIKQNKYVEWRALREIEAGVCDGMSYDQIKVRFPQEYRARMKDKLRYRYPRGESYFDVITRLDPVIFELERQKEPLLIVGHLAVLRCLYAYFLDLPIEELPFLTINSNTLIRLDPKAYGCKEKRVKIVNQKGGGGAGGHDSDYEEDHAGRGSA